MSEHRYRVQSLRGDYFRAGAGIAVCGGLVLTAGLDGPMFYVFAALTVLFALFGWRTWMRTATVVTIDDAGIAASGLGRARLAWRDLNRVKLSYFSTRRGRQDGWMQLTLAGAGGRIRIDSHIEDFDAIARRAHGAAMMQGVELNQATLANFASMGLVASDDGWGRPGEWGAAAQGTDAGASARSEAGS